MEQLNTVSVRLADKSSVNVNGRGDECTIYLTEGAVGASVGGLSNARWQALCLDPRVSRITSHELMKAYVNLFASNLRG